MRNLSDIIAAIGSMAEYDYDSTLEMAGALAQLARNDDSVVPALIQVLESAENRYARYVAAKALGEIRDPKSIPALVTAMREDRYSLACMGAAFALGRMIENEAAVLALIDALISNDEEMRKAAAPALIISGEKIPAHVLRGINDEKITELTALLAGDPVSDVRIAAARVLGKTDNPDVIPHLVRALDDRDPGVRLSALEALRELKATSAVNEIVACLQDYNEDIRRAAAAALGEIGGQQAVLGLVLALRDPSPDVRSEAAYGLGKAGNEDAVPVLCAMLADKSEDKRVRLAVISMLDKIGHQSAKPALLKIIVDEVEDADLRSFAEEVLWRINRKRAPESLE